MERTEERRAWKPEFQIDFIAAHSVGRLVKPPHNLVTHDVFQFAHTLPDVTLVL
jgi:hypothetical protein